MIEIIIESSTDNVDFYLYYGSDRLEAIIINEISNKPI